MLVEENIQFFLQRVFDKGYYSLFMLQYSGTVVANMCQFVDGRVFHSPSYSRISIHSFLNNRGILDSFIRK